MESLINSNKKNITVWLAVFIIVGVFIWQGVTQNGAPDPTLKSLHPLTAVLDTAILVFREGLEAILVLMAVTSSLTRTENKFWKPVFIGSGLSFIATIITWFIVVAIISAVNAPELSIQAGTGLLANIVLLIVMNWFFHNVYWTGWIKHHNKRKQSITESANGQHKSQTYLALIILGFTAVYREGFEVVLFLQNLRLQFGSIMILYGVLIGLFFTLIVGWLTFIAHTRLPYRKMLVLTGILLGVVLLVMVGETTFEMQQAGWISTTNINIAIPNWMGIWLSVFPNVETLGSQLFAIIFVVGSYYASRYVKRKQLVQKESTVSS